MDFIISNIGNIVVALVLILLVCAVVRHMVKDKKSGKSSCGGGCKGCANAPYCHPQAYQDVSRPGNPS